MHRLFPFSSNSTTSGSGASTSSPEAQTSLSSSPPSKSSMPKPKQPPVDRRQSLDAYRPLAERLRSHLSVSSSAQGSDSTPAISSEGAASTITATSSTSSSSTSGGKLRRSTSASSLHSGGSKERSKYKLKNLWHRVSGSVTSIPGAFLGGTGGDGQSAKSSTSAGAERATPLGGGEATQEAAPGQPQLIYFMGSRPSTETSPPTAPTSSSTSTAPPPYSISTQEQEVNLKPQGRHAKLLSMVDEGAEDDVELVEYDRDESSSSEEEEDDSSDEEEGVRRSGETTAVNSPAGVPPSQRVLPPPGVAASGVAGLGAAAAGSGTRTPTQRQTSRYVDPFAASPAIAPISVPPNSPEAPTAALPSTQATSMSFASFLGLTSSKPMFGFGSASATPTKQIDEGGEQPKVDPESLAQRIQELIDALPPPPIFNEIPQTPYPPTPYPPETPGDTYPGSPFPSRLPPPPKPRVPKRDSKTGRPIPPADAVPEGVDEDVVKLLWSVSVMGDQPLPEQGEGEGGEEGGEGEEKGDEETGKEPVEKGPVEEGEEKPTVPDTPKPNPDQRRRVPRTPVPRTPRSPRSPHRRHHPRTPGTRNIWQILEGYQTTGHIPATPYTGIGSGGTGAPGSVIPLPPVDEDESPDLGGGPIAGGDREEGGPVAGGDRERGGPIAGGDREGDTGGGGTNLFSDGGSIMLYSPLIPGLHDLVEMGEVVDILWEADEEDDEYLEDGVGVEYPGESEEGTTVVGSDSGLDTPKASDKGKGRGWVPSLGWWSSQPTAGVVQGDEKEDDRTPSPTLSAYGSPTFANNGGVSSAVKAVAGSGALHKRQGRTSDAQFARRKGGKVVRTRRMVAEQAWAPSKDKLTVQVFWWGYRLCLPPPTLAILSDKTIEATKRAAMITTALTWFLQNVPVTALPLPLQPTVLLLQRLAPYLGYVGTFISWSWQQIKSYDKGKGVLLTATWLLPIALIPGTWFDHSFPEPSPAPPAPALPAPPAPTPAPAPGGPVKNPTGTGKPTPETPTPAPAPAPVPPSGSTPVTNPPPSSTPTPTPNPPPASSTPVGTPPVTSPTTPGDPNEDEVKGQGKRTRKTSLTQTIASFVSRKAKIPSGLRSRKNSTSATNEAVVKASSPAAAPVAQVSRISSTSTSMTSPMDSVSGLPPAQRKHGSRASSRMVLPDSVAVVLPSGRNGGGYDEAGEPEGAVSTYTTPSGGPVVFPSAIAAGGVHSFAALAQTGSGSGSSTPAVGQSQTSTAVNPTLTTTSTSGMTMTTPMPSATTGGFVASGMLSPLTPGLVPPTQGGGYLPSPPDSPSPSVAPKTNKLKKRNSLTAGSRPDPTRKPTLGMNAVHPDSELGQELVKSWRVGTVDLPAPSPGGRKDEGEGEDAGKGDEKEKA